MLKETDLQELQARFTQERAGLLQDIQREQARLEAYNEENPDPLDLADRSRYQEISLNRLENLQKWLAEVEGALQRLSEGRYGICVRCGKPINPERLAAIPATAYCIKCQAHLERHY
jgi:DnaK suppressor protein